jgi:uncharacterized surface protein with fasciclin (FAS1) repeats
MVDSQRRQVLKAVGGAGALLAVGGVGTVSARNGKKQGASGDATIATIATNEGFEILVAALGATGLAGTFASNRGQFTVFAPTDQAFNDIGISLDGDDLVVEEPAASLLQHVPLEDVLLYHVTHGRRYAASLNDGEDVKMLNGDTTTVDVVSGAVSLNDSTVVAPDIEASNGVIHVIDAVLLP